MKIAFATPLAATASTIVGRTLPVVTQFAAASHDVHLLLLRGSSKPQQIPGIGLHEVGQEPFTRTEQGKQRLSGLALLFIMSSSAWRMAWQLRRLQPDVVILVKTLPISVAGVWLWRLLGGRGRIILDMDDFELAANHLSSILQRAVVHLAERRAIALADSIVVATPFLLDHAKQLAKANQTVTLIPTGLNKLDATVTGDKLQLVYLGSISIKSGHRVDLLPEILAKVRQRYPDIGLIIAGDGDDVAAIKSEFAKRNLANAVHFLGRFDPGQVTDLLSTNTIIIDPIDSSIEARAKSSYRVALASSLGLPVVTSDVGIRPTLLPESLHERLFALPNNAEDYAKKIIALCDTPLTDKEQESLRNHSKQFTWQKLAPQYLTTLSL